MGAHREAVEELGWDNPIARRALDAYRFGHMDYETALESAVLAQAASLREMEKHYLALVKAQPMHIVMPGPPCNTA